MVRGRLTTEGGRLAYTPVAAFPQRGFEMMAKKVRTMWMALALVALAGVSVTASAQAAAAPAADQVLGPAETEKLLPAKVYFKGQSATIQVRNSGGVKFADGYIVLSTLVDTSGYSSEIAGKYQAYFITEVTLKIEGHELPAGVYGVGFIADNKFVVQDVGAHDLFMVSSHKDAELKRPMPMKVVASADGFRLYAGRSYITFAR